MTTPNPEHHGDKRALALIAILCVILLGGVVYGVFATGNDPEKRDDALLGTLVAGVLLFLRDIVAAIRASWAEFTNSKTTDLLAGASPPPVEPAPKDAAEAARATADAADSKAAQIERTSLD